ncbi:MAG: substrate-binding domain-containing protein [Acidobacteria bacterium]|nr:substrate-binding domain-containing protein [Acidobacteriota bacterium]
MAEALWVCEHGGVAEAAAREHVRVRWNGPSSEDAVDEQIAIAEKAIDNDTYGLVLSPNSLFAMNTVIQRALRKDIPVVIVGASLPINAGGGLTFVLNDVDVAGQLAANHVKQVLREGDEVLVTGLDPTWPGSEDRARAFEKELNNVAPQIRIADKLSGAVSFGQAELQAEKALREHLKIGVVVSLNITSTRGAVAAVSALRASSHIRVMGFDQTLDLLTGLRQGRVDALVVQDMRIMGAMAVERVVATQRGEQPPARTLVKPVLVTRANIDTEAVQQVLRMDWRPRP